MTAGDPFDLARFLEAQAPVFTTAFAELKAGRKRSHWMWFVFPQLRGLGHSTMAQHYGIAAADEARAYLAHPVLGARLVTCTEAVLTSQARSLHDLFGSPDDLKFRSCMTLFAAVSPERENLFRLALDKWCGGIADERTLAALKAE